MRLESRGIVGKLTESSTNSFQAEADQIVARQCSACIELRGTCCGNEGECLAGWVRVALFLAGRGGWRVGRHIG
jgi:hypothetical protein